MGKASSRHDTNFSHVSRRLAASIKCLQSMARPTCVVVTSLTFVDPRSPQSKNIREIKRFCFFGTFIHSHANSCMAHVFFEADESFRVKLHCLQLYDCSKL